MKNMREKGRRIFWGLLCVSTVLFGVTSCSGDEQEMEQMEQQEELGGDQEDEGAMDYQSSEASADPISEGEMNTMEPAPLEIASGAEEPAVDAPMAPVGDDQGTAVEGDSQVLSPEAGMLPPSAPKEFTYNVVKGDWLSKIAGKVYGDIYRWDVIHRANPSIRNPNRIYPNHKLVIPITGPKSEAFARAYTGMGAIDPERNVIEKDKQNVNKYSSTVVMPGDTLSKIAENMMGDAAVWKKVFELNRDKIQNPDLIYAGQTLLLPASQVSKGELALEHNTHHGMTSS